MVDDSDEITLKVSGSSPPQSLGSAISHSMTQGKRVTLRCIGAASVNQAVKAVAIANGFMGQKGVTLSIRPGFLTVEMPGGEKVSAIVLRVFQS